MLLIADSHNGVVRRVGADGVITTFASGFAAPVVLEPGPEGTVYVADAGQRAVYRLSADGRARTLVARADVPIGLAVDDAGTVYVAELEGRKRVLRIARRPHDGAGNGPLIRRAFTDHDASTRVRRGAESSGREGEQCESTGPRLEGGQHHEAGRSRAPPGGSPAGLGTSGGERIRTSVG